MTDLGGEVTLKLLLMGTGEFAVPAFAALADGPHPVVGLVTQPDRGGPGHHDHRHPLELIKSACLQQGIPVLQPAKVNEADAIASIAALTVSEDGVLPLGVTAHGTLSLDDVDYSEEDGDGFETEATLRVTTLHGTVAFADLVTHVDGVATTLEQRPATVGGGTVFTLRGSIPSMYGRTTSRYSAGVSLTSEPGCGRERAICLALAGAMTSRL